MNLATNPLNGAAGDCKQDHCRECKSGFCVDGYCCNAACTGSCQACDVDPDQNGMDSRGSCVSLPTSAPQPQTNTAPQPIPPRSECTTPTCTPASQSYLGSTAVFAECAMGGTCNSPSSNSCFPYTICNGTSCATSCTKDSDCAATNPTTGSGAYYCDSAGQCASVLTAPGASCGASPCYGGGTNCRVCGRLDLHRQRRGRRLLLQQHDLRRLRLRPQRQLLRPPVPEQRRLCRRPLLPRREHALPVALTSPRRTMG